MARFFMTIIDQPDGKISVHSTLDNPIDQEKGPQTPTEKLAVGLVQILNQAMKKPEDTTTVAPQTGTANPADITSDEEITAV